MSSKTIGAQRPFKMLVPALQGSTDPSKGPSGNPVYKWKTFEQQYLVERPGPNRVIQSGKSPGVSNRTGILLTGFPPAAPSTGTIDVVGNTFVGPTSILLGAYTLNTGTDFQVGDFVQATASLVVTATPSTATINIGGVNLAPAGGARTPGANNYNNTLGTLNAIAAEIAAAINDGANGFAGFVTSLAVGSSVNLTAVPIGALGNAVTLSSNNGTVTVSSATLLGGLDDVEDTAINLAAAIDALPEYSATATGAQVSVSGAVLNITLFSKSGASPYNFTLTPNSGTLTGGDPHIGPPSLSL